MRAAVKSVIKVVENELTRNKWGNTPFNVLGVKHTTPVFLVWHVQVCASAIACLSHPDILVSSAE